MRFSEIFTFVACLATTAMASADDITPKASPEVLVCEHVGFGGQCRYLDAPLGSCHEHLFRRIFIICCAQPTSRFRVSTRPPFSPITNGESRHREFREECPPDSDEKQQK
ncbi:hypothetical protein T069G_02490 [Trichoderma breve]|uniref:Uncharacterized protein n=1 Tax=Trichoderma breve TaxID=2034170 RepID=A0A9W9BKY2_9HYPO|nr:hypothetical protein T069G_02490 [Trichoderma breve]KAJ4861536.1 hypothetical protein T069G_02490 [Trichoderma breve]